MAVSFTWLGHSGFIFDFDGRKAILDPFITNNPLIQMSAEEISVGYILLTHAHGDHVGYTEDSPAGDTLTIAAHSGATIVCNFEMGNWFYAHGAKNVHQGNTGGTMRGEFLDVKFTQAFHSSSFGDGTYGGMPHGFVITGGGMTLYHAGDTGLFGDMALIGEEGIDVAFLPIGDIYTMGIEDSVKAVKMLKPRYVVPTHYNTFPPIVQDVTHWADLINRTTDAQPIVLDPGQSYTFE